MSKKILVLGEGAWGTAIATVLVHNGNDVRLWCYDSAVADAITKNRINERYLPGIPLSSAIIPVGTSAAAFEGIDYIASAIPVVYLRSVLQSIHSYVPSVPWIVLSKGVEKDTAFLSSQIIEDEIASAVCAVLSGPSFAKDLAEQQLTTMAVGSSDNTLPEMIVDLFQNDYLIVQKSDDMIGIQVAGAIKNVIALAVGLVEGMGYGDNTRTFILMRGLHEMRTIINIYGGNQETSFGITGVGDAMMTALGGKSRNRECGRRFGAGQSLEKISTSMMGIVEGLNTLCALQMLSEQKNIRLPLINNLYRVFYKQLSSITFLKEQQGFPL